MVPSSASPAVHSRCAGRLAARASEDSASYTYSTAKTVIQTPYPAAALAEEHHLRKGCHSGRPQHRGQGTDDEPFSSNGGLLEFGEPSQALNGHDVGDGDGLPGKDGQAHGEAFQHADNGPSPQDPGCGLGGSFPRHRDVAVDGVTALRVAGVRFRGTCFPDTRL